MNTRSVIYTALIITIACSLYNLRAQTQAPLTSIKWEVASLNIVDRFNAILWSDPAYKGRDYEAYNKIGGRASKAEFDDAGVVGRARLFLNAAGAQGWELVTVQIDPSEVVGRVYWLRRESR